jgi:hypothetical protein
VDYHLLLQPFALGLELGLIFTAIALWRVIRLKMELGRFKTHLSDRIELEAGSVRQMKADLEEVRKENEQLRLRVAATSGKPEGRLQRELEIYARAEKQMVVNVPGFAGAWENAKTAAQAEVEREEAGKSLTKRVFSRWFNPGAGKDALPGSSSDTL